MPEDSAASRQRMVIGAADMIRRRGLNATSVRELAKHADAPLGSTYHYFPGGKYDLATEAVRWADDITARMLTQELKAGPLAGLKAFLAMWRKVVLDSDFHAGCPVLSVSVEDLPDKHSRPREAASAAFLNWTRILGDSLREHGVKSADAERLAILIVAAVEGTVAMCRAHRSIEPLDQVAEELSRLIEDAVALGRTDGH
ncbi:TetR/AcrR family transcriptional regulator [Mycolicibacter heraklionensis]|uniref:TetR/AcrR family transcriptional regulator n=1 Tax=Mycolicibacter heraklionensis TaxID=512402 RepID=UPI0007EF072C|nr:TetR/AcrR family transcriptional regulator [Mycolicibacter heraklionensis]OBJ34304.1 TetR family transcriptional regulator [Mycolicibacter heraklionensis]